MSKTDIHQIESSIWDMANKLRNSMDASDYKNYILAFMFYRFLSEKQAKYVVAEEIVDVKPGENPAFAVMREIFKTDDLTKMKEYADASRGFSIFYREKRNNKDQIIYGANGKTVTEPVGPWVEQYELYLRNVADFLGYCIPPLYDWKVLQVMTQEQGIQASDYQAMFDAFNASLKYNKSAETNFEGIFSDVNLGDSRLGTTVVERAKALGRIVDQVDGIMYVDDEGKDILGRIYEYLIKQFAATAGKKGGEFYTPHSVSSLMAKIVTDGREKSNKTFYVFDPTCGSGSLLLTVGKTLPGGARPGAISYYGQEKNTTTYNLARMNLMMNNVGYSYMHLRNADTLGSDWPDGVGPDGKDHMRVFDAVVANPPYSAHWEASDNYLKDPRFRDYGGKLAPKTKADYAFLLDGLYHLRQDGTMAIVLPHGVLFRGAAEAPIRTSLVENNLIDTIIGLPANLFYGTGIPTVVMVLKRNKTSKDILFIDASNEFKKAKNMNELTDENIEKIFKTYQERKDVERYAHLASIKEIRDNDYNLNIPRYVDTSEEEPEIDLKEVEHQLNEVEKEIEKLQEVINKQLRELGVIE